MSGPKAKGVGVRLQHGAPSVRKAWVSGMRCAQAQKISLWMAVQAAAWLANAAKANNASVASKRSAGGKHVNIHLKTWEDDMTHAKWQGMKLAGVVVGHSLDKKQEKGLEYVQKQLTGTKLSKHCELIYKICVELRKAAEETLFPVTSLHIPYTSSKATRALRALTHHPQSK